MGQVQQLKGVSVSVKEQVAEVHVGYVNELAKVEFLTQSLNAMIEDLEPLPVNLHGYVLAMTEAVQGLSRLNDDLDRIRFS